ncbi:MAG: hypothetical protein EOS11_08565 [Mesorhizobium sp.]|nr:MAG: hypothetical protein EOS10_06615 [Mesorhizobium sp.]RWO46181.1 MAG: hypothetical protein EOS11_08565 [Mesorhizobium sp.]
MTTAKPLAHYSAIEGALASGFATAELHHLWGRDRDQYLFIEASLPKPGSPLGLSRPGRIDTLVRPFDQTYRDKVALVARLPITLSGVRDQRVSLSSTSFRRADTSKGALLQVQARLWLGGRASAADPSVDHRDEPALSGRSCPGGE